MQQEGPTDWLKVQLVAVALERGINQKGMDVPEEVRYWRSNGNRPDWFVDTQTEREQVAWWRRNLQLQVSYH